MTKRGMHKRHGRVEQVGVAGGWWQVGVAGGCEVKRTCSSLYLLSSAFFCRMSLANCMQARHEDDDYDVDAESSLAPKPPQKSTHHAPFIHPSSPLLIHPPEGQPRTWTWEWNFRLGVSIGGGLSSAQLSIRIFLTLDICQGNGMEWSGVGKQWL